MAEHPTFAYENDGRILALDGNSVIASGTDFSKVAETAEEYFSALRSEHEKTARAEATHIVTPNGERGTILGRTASLWADEITVRFDNGQIRHFATYAGDGFRYTAGDEDVPKTPIEDLQKRVDAMPDPTRVGLTARLNELTDIRNSAQNLITAHTSNSDLNKLHQIALAADTEKEEVKEALAYLQDADEAYEPPTRSYAAVEQASMGHKNDWLEVVAQEMIAESEAQDFDKILAEGPTTLVSSLEDAVVASTGATRDIAVGFIQSKTAGFKGPEVEEYRYQFVASTEVARQRELTYRTQVAKTAALEKEASVADVPDEALFF